MVVKRKERVMTGSLGQDARAQLVWERGVSFTVLRLHTHTRFLSDPFKLPPSLSVTLLCRRAERMHAVGSTQTKYGYGGISRSLLFDFFERTGNRYAFLKKLITFKVI